MLSVISAVLKTYPSPSGQSEWRPQLSGTAAAYLIFSFELGQISPTLSYGAEDIEGFEQVSGLFPYLRKAHGEEPSAGFRERKPRAHTVGDW